MRPGAYNRTNFMTLRNLLTLGLVGIASIVQAGQVVGEITYRERIALPPNSVVILRIDNVTDADQPRLTSELKFATGGKQVPITFQVPFQDSAIKKGHKYVLRAAILIGAQTLFATSNDVPVIHNRVRRVSLTLKRVVPAQEPIQGVTWKLAELRGKPLQLGSKGAPTVKFDVDGRRFSSYTGVNQLTGAFRITGSSINITPGTQTLIGASEELMEQERSFVSMLREATAFRVVEGRLELVKGSEIVARFEK